MEVTDRAAYESLRRKYDYLTTALQPANILPSLFASGLISIVQMQEIELAIHERGPPQGCSKLLDMLLSNGSEGAFEKFLDVLRNKFHLRYLVPELQSEFSFTHPMYVCIYYSNHSQLKPTAIITGYLTIRIRMYVMRMESVQHG